MRELKQLGKPYWYENLTLHIPLLCHPTYHCLFQEADWVDTDEKLTLLAEQAKSLLDEYRSVYTVDSPVDELYHSMHSLYIASEAAMISDAYAEHVEVVFRDHEDMVGALGSK